MKTEKKNNQKKGFWNWLVRGTVSEPWPTKEELLNDPKIQEKMKTVRDIFSKGKQRKDREA